MTKAGNLWRCDGCKRSYLSMATIGFCPHCRTRLCWHGATGVEAETALREGYRTILWEQSAWTGTDVPVGTVESVGPPPRMLFHVGDGIREPVLKGDVGYDLIVSETTDIPGRSFRNIPHDVKVHIPKGYWGLILARSSVNIAGQLVILPGLIDAGYRGKLFGLAHNMTDHTIFVRKASRVCQLVLLPAVLFPAMAVDKLTPSERSVQGFGSTGGTNGDVRNPNLE